MSLDQNLGNLDERSQNVLRTLIREYVRRGKPVGSRSLSKLYREGLSPATIRNIMSDLEEEGYLSQPHISAGRVPTAQGYRTYVETLPSKRGLTTQEVENIWENLKHETDPAELMDKASRLLSAYTDNIGIVVSPRISDVVLKHIEFVPLSDKKILVILVGEGGLVQHKLIRVDENLSKVALDQAGNYLVTNFEGMTLSEIRLELLRLLTKEKALYDQLLQNVLLLGSVSLVQPDDSATDGPQVYLGGTSRVIPRLEEEDLDRLMSLLETFEEKSRLVKIIGKCLSEGDNRPSITIGLEDHIPGMQNWTLITSSYSYKHQSSGSLGVLGPSRMQYERAISLVNYVAKLFDQILHSS